MFLVVGCQTTQSAETETVPEVVKEVQQLPKEEELSKNNPFEKSPIPPNQVVTSTKPVICGRIDIILSRMEKKFGEVPIMFGKVAAVTPNNDEVLVMSTLTYNAETGTYTFLEQMPVEQRLLCILSVGKAKLKESGEGTKL
jgi:hypothetical protein